jgi:hypothetical protein
MRPSPWKLALAATTFVGLAGCAPPCNSLCDTQAEYIEFCLVNGSQADWTSLAAGGGFAVYGYSDADEFVAGCQEDFTSQLTGPHADIVEAECTDEDNRVAQLVDRGLCGDVP